MSSLTDNTAKWEVRKLTKFQGNSGLPVGFEYFSTNPNIPVGSIPLFGGEYSREIYSDLWSWVQEQAGYLIEESAWQEKSAANGGNVPFYSKGNGTTTFRVPSLKCWVKGANGIEEVGSYLSAGLPNITGSASAQTNAGLLEVVGDSTNTWGCFGSGSEVYNNHCSYVANAGKGRNLYFDASKSNAIYGNSDTVQPKSIVGMWLVKAYGTVTNVGSTDVSAIAQGLTENETAISALAERTDVVAKSNGNYIRYANGVQICWGYMEINTASGSKLWNYPMPFAEVPNISCASWWGSTTITSINNQVEDGTWIDTSISINILWTNGGTNSRALHIIAIGWWK